MQSYCYLAACAEAAWQKYKKYYVKANNTGAYYATIVLNLTFKMQWFYDQWVQHEEKTAWILKIKKAVKKL